MTQERINLIGNIYYNMEKVGGRTVFCALSGLPDRALDILLGDPDQYPWIKNPAAYKCTGNDHTPHKIWTRNLATLSTQLTCLNPMGDDTDFSLLAEALQFPTADYAEAYFEKMAKDWREKIETISNTLAQLEFYESGAEHDNNARHDVIFILRLAVGHTHSSLGLISMRGLPSPSPEDVIKTVKTKLEIIRNQVIAAHFDL